MNIIQKYFLLLLTMIPLFLRSQNSILLDVHPYHLDNVKRHFADHPLLFDKLKMDSSTVSISIFTNDCKGGTIRVDSINFYFKANNHPIKNIITIVPESNTSFSSHIFAVGLYEGARIFEKPKTTKKPLFIVAETDELKSLIFIDQRIDKKNEIWYYVQFTCKRNIDDSTETQEIDIKGWVLRGRSRLYHWGGICY